MSIAIYIPENWEPAKLVLWSTTIARAKGEDLLIIQPKRLATPHERKKAPLNVDTDRSPLAVAIREHAADFDVVDLTAQKDDKSTTPRKGTRLKNRKSQDAKPSIFLKRLTYSELVPGVLKNIKELRVGLLIVPRHRGVRISEEAFAVERQLFLQVPCETLLLRPGKTFSDNFNSILVANNGSKHAFPALNLGATFATSNEKKLTALYVEQADTPAAKPAQPKRVQRAVRKSFKTKAECVTPDTVVDADVPRGLRSYATAKGHDLIIVGAGGRLAEDRVVLASVPEKLMAETDEPTVVVVRNAMPLGGRLIKSIEQRKKGIVPQLDRVGRIELVERLQSCTKWDFDFVLLIILATLLASLGLALNSPPVVIGAMLVAPLMTPMLGLGLSVVQGNRRMAKSCLATVGRGFLAALATGCFVGLMRTVFAPNVTEQMANRGAPGVLDLVVAFVSGIVAAYAFGRPHLFSVLPGIAIATSLVPPVATAGLAVFALDFDVALGATLLFLSNFIAIVLGSASSFWFVGMRGPRKVCAFTAWAQRWMLGFFTVAVCLAVFFSVRRNEDSQAHASSVNGMMVTDTHPASQPPSNVAGRQPPDPEQAMSTKPDDAQPHQEDAPTTAKRTVVLKPAAPPQNQPPAPAETEKTQGAPQPGRSTGNDSAKSGTKNPNPRKRPIRNFFRQRLLDLPPLPSEER